MGELVVQYETGLSRVVVWEEVRDAYLASNCDSPHTRRSYRRHITTACDWMAIETLRDLNGRDLSAYRAHVTGSPVSPASQAVALAALRSFLGWARTMGAHDLPDTVIAEALKTPRATVRKPYSVLTEKEVLAILTASKPGRDRAILSLILGSGLRVSEVVGLDVSDLREDNDGLPFLFVSQGKGRKDRSVPIQEDLLRVLLDYLKQTGRHMGGDGPLFLTHDRSGGPAHRKGRLTQNAINEMVRTYANKITAKRISPHSLRHSYAVRNLKNGASVVAVSKLLGHASIQTTQRYLDHLDMSELRAAVAPLPAVG